MYERVRRSLVFLTIVFVALAGVGFVSDVMRTEVNVVDETAAHVARAAHAVAVTEALVARRRDQPIDVVLVGDIMLDRGVKKSVERNGGEFDMLFAPLLETLTEADVAFANLEGAISDTGTDGGKAYSFRFTPKVTDALARAGFDVLSQANNHALDWGYEALCDSVRRLRAAHIASIGAGCDRAEANKPWIIDVRGTTIAFIAYTEFDTWGTATDDNAGLSRFNFDEMKQSVQNLKNSEKVDVVFVSLHWGDEYEVRSDEAQQELGRVLIDAGADVIVGHHPHVVQEIEQYANGWIIYSLGNFIFDQSFSKETMEGLLVRVKLYQGHVSSVEPATVTLDKYFVPSLTDKHPITE